MHHYHHQHQQQQQQPNFIETMILAKILLFYIMTGYKMDSSIFYFHHIIIIIIIINGMCLFFFFHLFSYYCCRMSIPKRVFKGVHQKKSGLSFILNGMRHFGCAMNWNFSVSARHLRWMFSASQFISRDHNRNTWFFHWCVPCVCPSVSSCFFSLSLNFPNRHYLQQ